MITEKKEKHPYGYFQIEADSLEVKNLELALKVLNEKAKEAFQESTCELILVP